MKLQYLEYFMAVSKNGSLGKAATELYTTQPNVSKVIRAMEKELGYPLFERSSKGLKLNNNGKLVYEYASNALKNIEMISGIMPGEEKPSIRISTYQSNTLARMLVKVYKEFPDLYIEHRQGNIEEVINHVENGISEIGIIYVAKKYKQALLNVLTRKGLDFHEVGSARACISAGPASPIYGKDEISYADLANLKYVRGIQDYFSEEDFSSDNIGIAAADTMKATVCTNCNQMVSDLLEETDLVYLSIDVAFNMDEFENVNYKKINIDDSEISMVMGYITSKDYICTEPVQCYLKLLPLLFQKH